MQMGVRCFKRQEHPCVKGCSCFFAYMSSVEAFLFFKGHGPEKYLAAAVELQEHGAFVLGRGQDFA